jgi:hypothetical protein
MLLEKFLFCEMARNEANGQVSLVGLHVGDQIIVQMPADVPLNLLPNLSCVVILGDMKSVRRLRMQCQVRFLDKEVLATPAQDTVIANPQQFHNILLGFSPFPCLQGPGNYEFRITVQAGTDAAVTYSRQFSILRQPFQTPTTH